MTNSQHIELTSSEERNLKHQVDNLSKVILLSREGKGVADGSQNGVLGGVLSMFVEYPVGREKKKTMWVTSLYRWGGKWSSAGVAP